MTELLVGLPPDSARMRDETSNRIHQYRSGPDASAVGRERELSDANPSTQESSPAPLFNSDKEPDDTTSNRELVSLLRWEPRFAQRPDHLSRRGG